jgi:hypothetical protein
MTRSSAPIVVLALTTLAVMPFRATQGSGEDPARGTDMPIVREAHFVVNARIRPLLFWMGRDDVGGARMTWRAGGETRRGIELLIGSDPARTPRQINRWGFLAEQVSGTSADVVGVMKGSSEETLEEARASVTEETGARSLFKAVHTTIDGNRVVTQTSSFTAPPSLTYHQLDAVLAMWPAGSNVTRSFDLPPGTEKGFLLAMTSLIAESAHACRAGAAAGRLHGAPYLYDQTVYELSLASCASRPELRTSNGLWTDIVDGRFEVRNRRTGELTKFELSYGRSHEWWQVPIRAVFRPRWWMEVELLLDPPTGARR